MNKYIKRSMWFVVVMFGLQAIGSAELFIGELESKNTVPDISNIGFMVNPPKELKEKFPMCDAFLKVKWIDEEKEVAYSFYDIYKDGKKVSKPRGALIFIKERHPRFDYDVDKWRKKGKLKELFSNIRNSKQIEGYLPESTRIHIPTDDWSAISLSDYRKNVCIPYPPHKSIGFYKGEFWEKNMPDIYDPSDQRMWIVEIRQVGKVYNDQQIKEKVEKIKTVMTPVDTFPGYDAFLDLKKYSAVDFNGDGIEDYLAGTDAVGDTVYSHENQYYKMTPMWAQQLEDSFGEYQFPTSHQTCRAGLPSDFYLTTDGKNYFLNNRCILNEFTK